MKNIEKIFIYTFLLEIAYMPCLLAAFPLKLVKIMCHSDLLCILFLTLVCVIPYLVPLYIHVIMRISLISGVDFVDKIHKAAKELQKNSGYQSSYTPPSEASSGNYIPNYQ